MIPSRRPPINERYVAKQNETVKLNTGIPSYMTPAWVPPREEIIVSKPSPSLPNPYHEEWIQEWRNALTKSAYPLWEEWFQKRDWRCFGHLTVKEASWFSSSLHVGEIDLRHKFTVSGGSTRLNGDLHVFGKIWHHPVSKPKVMTVNDEMAPEWELVEPVESYQWNEIMDKSQIQLHPHDNKGIWSSWNNEVGIGCIQDLKEKRVKFITWNGNEDLYHEQNNDDVILDVNQVDTNQLNVNIANIQEIQSQKLIVKGEQVHINSSTKIDGNFEIGKWVQVDDEGCIHLKGSSLNCTSLMRCEQIISYETFTCPRILIDEWIETKNMRIHENTYMNGDLVVNGVNGISALQMRIHHDPSNKNHKWFHIPSSLREITVSNLNAELWNGRAYPDIDKFGEVMTEKGVHEMSNKSLGSELNANQQRIRNLPEPKESNEVATKGYVDNLRLPWRMFGDVKQWIPLSQVKKWGRFVIENHIWMGEFHRGIESTWKILREGDIIGIYPDVRPVGDNIPWYGLDYGCGLFQLMEHGDGGNMNEIGKRYEFTWIMYKPYYEWATREPSSGDVGNIWVGGPEGINGGAKLMVIQSRRDERNEVLCQWNILMSWADVPRAVSLEDRVKELEARLEKILGERV